MYFMLYGLGWSAVPDLCVCFDAQRVNSLIVLQQYSFQWKRSRYGTR